MITILLYAKNIVKSFSDRQLLAIDHLRIYIGDKISLVGDNGCGKTTLLNILYGIDIPDSGNIVRKCNISHVKQLLNENSRYNSNGRTFGEFCLSNTVDNEKMSGGELTKIKIIQSLEENAPLYFLDEPTSNLDTNSANIVYGILERIDSFILVSHDRGLLDALCTKIWEVKKGEIQEYPGNFSNYLACQSIKEIEEWREYENYINEKKRLSNIADEKRKMAAKVVKKPQQHVG